MKTKHLMVDEEEWLREHLSTCIGGLGDHVIDFARRLSEARQQIEALKTSTEISKIVLDK